MIGPLDVDIHPEPSPAEAAAIVDAVGGAIEEDRAFAPPAVLRGRWRRAAAVEAVDPPASRP